MADNSVVQMAAMKAGEKEATKAAKMAAWLADMMVVQTVVS